MKALSLIQPWASLWLHRIKRFETRSWRTGFRGELAVHASAAAIPRDLDVELRVVCEHHFGADWRAALPQGRRHRHRPGHRLPSGREPPCRGDHVIAHAEEEALGNFAPGRWAWDADMADASVRVFLPPVPAKGSRGLWDWPGDSEHAVPLATIVEANAR